MTRGSSSKRDGRFVSSWGERGIRPGRFRFPAGVAVGSDGRVVVADAFNHRVQVFTPDGRATDRWGGIGWGIGGSRPGWFRVSKEVALDSAGHVWVAGVAVDGEGTGYVMDFFGGGVRRVECP